MPMPPPKPSTEGARDRQSRQEVRQLTRAIADLGPTTPERLADAVGARYWEAGRFEQALAYAVTDGVVVRGTDGMLTTV
jgi:hypothetical protein